MAGGVEGVGVGGGGVLYRCYSSTLAGTLAALWLLWWCSREVVQWRVSAGRMGSGGGYFEAE